MPIPKAKKIWLDGRMVPWDQARIHVLSHVVHYGSSTFEGIRCYRTARGPAIFRLDDHLERFLNSCKIYRMELPWSLADLNLAAREVVRVNGLQDCYLRPFAFRGYGEMGLYPLRCPIQVGLAAWRWGTYLGEEGLEKGVKAKVSTWNKTAPNTIPTLAKAGGGYLNSQLTKIEAVQAGCEEGIALDVNNYVSEGSGENVFLVRGGSLYTPHSGHSILPGITRHSVIVLARERGLKVHQQSIPREALYICDELFFTGTAAELTPIREVDGIKVGNGRRGPVTKMLQDDFFAILKGEVADRHHWLTPVGKKSRSKS